VLAASLVSFYGCAPRDSAAPANPKQAAAQLDQVFQSAAGQVKQNADTASDAMRKGDYEAAVVSLQVVRDSGAVTMEQGLAIHTSAVAMETQLIRAIEAGDERAKRAYELLKRFKRN
jgi:hypothetical protein